jgi:hypothetical protein
MQTIWKSSQVGDSYTRAVDGETRTRLKCATEQQVRDGSFVPQDGVLYKQFGKTRLGLAHVRVKEQINDLNKMVEWVRNKNNVNVRLVGNYAKQPGPADAIVKALSGYVFGYASGITEIYAHIKKPRGHLENVDDDTGHIPAFLAKVTGDSENECWIGTASLVGCVGVLVTQVGLNVEMLKIHLYDCENTVTQGKAILGNKLKSVVV